MISYYTDDELSYVTYRIGKATTIIKWKSEIIYPDYLMSFNLLLCEHTHI